MLQRCSIYPKLQIRIAVHGHDNISSSTLKCIVHEICECLTLIINQSIATEIFPENLKIAKVVPIYKKDDQSQIKNCRPIPVLLVISKIFENAMHSQLMEYFTSHQLSSNQQYGFRPNNVIMYPVDWLALHLKFGSVYF